MKTAEQVAHTSGVYGKHLQVCAFKCALRHVRIFNKGAATAYVQVHDSAAAPSDMSSCRMVIPVEPGLFGGETFTDGAAFKNGVYLYASTSVSALAAVAGNELLPVAWYRQERH